MPRLPPELLRPILNGLNVNSQYFYGGILISIALVSRDWNAEAVRLIWERLWLSKLSTAEKVLTILRTRHTMHDYGTYVRDVILEEFGIENAGDLEIEPRLLGALCQYCPNVVSLELRLGNRLEDIELGIDVVPSSWSMLSRLIIKDDYRTLTDEEWYAFVSRVSPLTVIHVKSLSESMIVELLPRCGDQLLELCVEREESYDMVSDALFDAVSTHCPRIRSLKDMCMDAGLEEAGVSDAALERLTARCPEIEVLQLECGRLTADGLREISRLHSLTCLTLQGISHNIVPDSDAAWAAIAKGCHQLRVLHVLEGSYLTVGFFTTLVERENGLKWKNITVLDVSDAIVNNSEIKNMPWSVGFRGHLAGYSFCWGSSWEPDF